MWSEDEDRSFHRTPLIGAAVLIVAVVVWFAFDDWARTGVLNAAHSSVPFLIPVLAGVVLGTLVLLNEGAVRWLCGLLLVVSVGLSVWYWSTYSYETKQQYLAAVTTVSDEVPTFAERAAYQVADAQATDNLGDVRGTLQAVRYVPDADGNTFNALVTRPGTFTGYTVVEEGHVQLTGSASATTCEFSAQAGKRLGGHLGSSLDRAIAAAAPGTFFESGDAYGFCDGDTPMVVVPLQRLSGFWHITSKPAGVAVYDGSNGTLKVLDEVADGDLPGPVYPMSLAAKVRSATEASGSYWDYVKDRAGYDTTAGDDADTTSGGNVSELSLQLADSEAGMFVTALTPRGGSETITALGVTSSTSVSAGAWNAYVVHELSTDRKPNSTLAENIRGDYGDAPEWAAGMEIFEIAPVDQDTWVASLGQEKNILYRVYVDGDGSSCLTYADGTKVRCGKVTGTGDNGIGVALQPSTGSTVDVPASSAELAKMSDADLAALLAQVSAEVATRMATSK